MPSLKEEDYITRIL
ncbi:hypothetical protein S40293_10303 [Stachybotrys chartarum IBT 40293]|nr:hypothetical protein S40293_10303 [Stachybotrys chartarum IBT 40293]